MVAGINRRSFLGFVVVGPLLLKHGKLFGSTTKPGFIPTHFEDAYAALNRMSGSFPTKGTALRVDSLEATLRILTFNESHAQLWKNLPYDITDATLGKRLLRRR